MNELDFVDKDIADFFCSLPGGGDPSRFKPGLPTQMQIAKYIKRLCEIMENEERLERLLQHKQRLQQPEQH